MDTIEISVIISTYNQPEWLEKVLWSYEYQTYRKFEVIIADDGSNFKTKELIQKIKSEVLYPINHIWHPDNGFQKTVILNKAIIASRSDYLLFTDGDCIARKDFVETHLRLRKENTFLSGGYFKLPLAISQLITIEDIRQQVCFDINWLKDRGIKSSFKNNKITARGLREKLLNNLTPTKATFDGMNVSGWKKSIIAVNGFDERMQYGGEDRELGERLMNLGLKFRQIRYSAICLHLDHDRNYVNQEMLQNNKEIRNETKKRRKTYTSFGILKG